MSTSTLQFRPCYRQIDEMTVTTFLCAHKHELRLPDRAAVCQVIERLFIHGGILGAFNEQQQMQAMLGFFFGEPSQNFANKEVLFIYVTALAREYRLTRAFRDGLLYSLAHFQQMGVKEIRMQAGVTDRYTNKLYGRFANPLGEGKTLRGASVMTYGNKIDAALAAITHLYPAETQLPTHPMSGLLLPRKSAVFCPHKQVTPPQSRTAPANAAQSAPILR